MLGIKQKEILHLMSEGYELGLDISYRGGYWLQKGGLGRGGESKHDISSDVCWSLRRKDYISTKYRRFPTEAFQLTKLGKKALALAEVK